MADRFVCEKCGKVYKTRDAKPKCPACGTVPSKDFRGIIFLGAVALFVLVVIAVLMFATS